MTKVFYTIFLFLCISTLAAQETLDASDPSNFVIGGAQGYQFLSMNLLEVQIIDVEPEINNTISFTVDPNTLEAGLPVFAGAGGAVNEDLWLNITSRSANADTYNAQVYCNQPVPVGFEIKIQLLNALSVDGTGDTGIANTNEFVISETPQIIITDIARGFTNDGVNKGFQIRYTITNSNGGSLPVGFEIVYELVIN
ncbi:hypothetical protein [Maribacter sp.]|uniref:hypothetical protein n=1 Tax=Maribacter sp. TaxID=1897614 RepID=UPI00329A4C60